MNTKYTIGIKLWIWMKSIIILQHQQIGPAPNKISSSLINSTASMCPFIRSDGQARCQDLEKGGLFWKIENCANDLDPNFHCSWISFTRFDRKLRRNFSESSEIQTFFPPKIRWSPKKKRSSPKLRLIFRPKSEIQTFAGGCFPMGGGGLFLIFHEKSASKSPKTCDFAYFTSQWGSSSPPAPPGYATVDGPNNAQKPLTLVELFIDGLIVALRFCLWWFEKSGLEATNC